MPPYSGLFRGRLTALIRPHRAPLRAFVALRGLPFGASGCFWVLLCFCVLLGCASGDIHQLALHMHHTADVGPFSLADSADTIPIHVNSIDLAAWHVKSLQGDKYGVPRVDARAVPYLTTRTSEINSSGCAAGAPIQRPVTLPPTGGGRPASERKSARGTVSAVHCFCGGRPERRNS